MAKVIVAPRILDFSSPTLFLAGAIDMGAAVDWQAQVIADLADYRRLIIFNPRRAAFTPDTLDEQIHWELKALQAADRILMWLPASAKAPVTMLEAGLYMGHDKLMLGAEAGFYRRRNLELTAERWGKRLYSSLEEMVGEIKEWNKDWSAVHR